MKKNTKKFISIAIAVAIGLVVIKVFADEGTIRNAANALVNWVATSFGLTGPNLF